MVTARFLRSSILGCAASALFGCQDQPLSITAPPAPVAEIVDGARAGNKHFFFLPPLVPAPTFSGTSDGAQKPIVKVCEWSRTASTCLARIAEFSMTSGTAAQVIRYDAKNQLYVVNWPSGQCVSGPCILDPTKAYRLRVLIGVAELGHGDMQVVKTSSGLKTVNTTQCIGLLQGSTLAVKFRIEQGATATGAPGTPATVGLEGGTVTSADGAVALIIPPEALSQNTLITVAPRTAALDGGLLAGSVYALEPSGTKFATPVTLTIQYDPTKIPAGVDEGSLKLYENSGSGWERVASGPGFTDHAVSGAIRHFSNAAAGVPVGYVHVLSPEFGHPYAGYWVRLQAVTLGTQGAPYGYIDTLSGRVVTWASLDPGVATVDQTGLVNILSPSPARTTITATSEGVTGSWELVVEPTPVAVASVTMDPASASVQKGQAVRLTATTRDADGNPLDRNITSWVTANENVAVLEGFNASSPSWAVVTGANEGSAIITATSGPAEPVNGVITGSATITVTPLFLRVTPAWATISAGQALQLSATPVDANGNPLSGESVSWASSDQAVATVDMSSGLVMGVAFGWVDITATSSGGKSTTAPIFVLPCAVFNTCF